MFSLIRKIVLPAVCLLVFLNACQNNDTVATSEAVTAVKKIPAPEFDANNAYELIKKQVSFGPRYPGTEAQKKCAAWMETELKKYADTVYVQQATLTQPGSNKTYPAVNIIASFNPNAEDRVLLLAHWDSRPWADEDSKDKDKPILAADDGGSGVAVLMEIAAKMKTTRPNIGVDILLEDAEDVGRTEWGELSYCLGTQYWVKNPHLPGYRAMFGILLDMVGAKGARFPLEAQSQQYAGSIQREIWETARSAGYSDYFVSERGSAITDDHIVINTDAHIPCVDIINLKADGSFADHWHTHQDDMNIIDKGTLKAVGQTVMAVIYNQ